MEVHASFRDPPPPARPPTPHPQSFKNYWEWEPCSGDIQIFKHFQAVTMFYWYKGTSEIFLKAGVIFRTLRICSSPTTIPQLIELTSFQDRWWHMAFKGRYSTHLLSSFLRDRSTLYFTPLTFNTFQGREYSAERHTFTPFTRAF